MTDISIIIPVYNDEKDLPQCLDRVLEQTLPDIELICIDDGSTDATPDILQKYAQQDRRIKTVRQENKGAGAARNRGLQLAAGKYIAFMDGDDLYPEKTTLEKLFAAAEKNNCDICGGSLAYLNKNEMIAPTETDYIFAEEGFCGYDEYQYDYGYTRFIYRTGFIRKNRLYFPDYLRGQDPPFFVRAMIAAKRFYRLPYVCYLYRMHEEPQPPQTPAQICGKFSSFRDILQMSADAGLAKLHYIQAERLNNYVRKIKHEFNNQQIKRLIGETAGAADCRLLAKVNPDFKFDDFVKFTVSPCKVSVIVPVYNVAPYLAKCLDSIINQSCRETEIICVNDGSTDGSLEILRQYEKRDPRITIINQENAGLSAARNNGLKKASAPYIAFIDSDDWIAPDIWKRCFRLCSQPTPTAPSAAALIFSKAPNNIAVRGRRRYGPYPNGAKDCSPIEKLPLIILSPTPGQKFTKNH